MVCSGVKNLHVTRDARGVVSVMLDCADRSVNVLSKEMFSDLQELIDDLEHDPSARLVLFRSGKKSGFLAGADLRELYAIGSRDRADHISLIGQKVFDRLERLSLPTIAAIRGPCLGGGLEFALACRYRVACDDDRTRLGLPEVELGLAPAWGGTQRLPDRVGLATAVDMILLARRVSPPEALELGLVDAVWSAFEFEEGVERFVSDLLAERIAVGPVGTAVVLPHFATQDNSAAITPNPGPSSVQRSLGDCPGSGVNEHQSVYALPWDAARAAALTAVERGRRQGRQAGLAQERAALADLLFTPACRERLHGFLFKHQRPHTGRATEANSVAIAAPAPNVPADAEKPWVNGLTIGQVLRQTARRFGHRQALVFSHAAVRWTWAEFDRNVDRVARGLLAIGLRRGDHLGVWSTNWPEWVLLQFATARIGLVLVTINPAYRPAELRYALAQSDVRGLALIGRFRTSDYFQMLREVCPELDTSRPGELNSPEFPRLRWLIAMRGAEHPGMLPWQALEAAGDGLSPREFEDAQRQLDPGDPVSLQYTSGTTGLPKGALLSHRNLLLNAFYASDGQRLDERDRICAPVPLYHCFGCVLGTMCAAVRGTAVIFPSESFDAEATLQAIEAERCTAVYGVPTMFIVEMEHPSFPGRDMSSLRTGIMAGSPCPIELMKRVVNVMGAREITIAYGQTEASPLATMTRTDDPIEKRVGTVGRPLPGIEVKIVDALTGMGLPDGQPGEVCCRGHNVMLGYYNMPEATARAIDRDGWLHTGDMGLRQPDGYFRITGRIREIIVRGGENVAPREIEELLYQHPNVEQVAAVGVPDRKFGEEILAWVKLRAGARTTEEEIRQFCRARLAHFKVPRYVKFVDGFPMTVTGKIQKYKIRQQAIEELALHEAAAIETA